MIGGRLRSALVVLGSIAVALLPTGCEDLLQEPESGNTPLPVQLEELSGNEQSGASGAPLAEPLRVLVHGPEDQPLPGLWVEWTVVSGSGDVIPRNAFSDEQGIAETTWVLGRDLGPQRVRASVRGGTPMEFEALAVEP